MNHPKSILAVAALLAALACSPAQAGLSMSTETHGAEAAGSALLRQLEAVAPLSAGPAVALEHSQALSHPDPQAIELTLWQFIKTLRAQRSAHAFEMLELRLSVVQVTLGGEPVSQVPLPGAAWLMLMGLLGFAGVKLTGQRNAATAPEHAAMGLPAPAAA
jgi:hypothetical protein